MKSILVILIVILTVPMVKANGKEVLSSMEKRNNSINRIILRSFRNPDFKWIRIGEPNSDEYGTKSTYTLENEIDDDVKTLFCFEEMHLINHPEIHTLSDLFENSKKNFSYELGIERDLDGNPFLVKAFYKFNIISQKEKSVCYERRCLVSERKLKVNADEKNISDEFLAIGEYSFDGPGTVWENPAYYSVSWIVDLGGGEFRKYDYGFGNEMPSEEDIKQFMKHFKLLEAEIKHVSS